MVGSKILNSLGKENLIALVVITLMQFIFFHEQLLGIQYFWSGYWSDITEFTASFLRLNYDALSKGTLPFWNPYSYSGIPHLVDPVTGFFYPINHLGFILVQLGMSVFEWVKYATIFHFWLLQVGMYLLIRYYRMDLIPALFGSCAFTLSSVCMGTFMIPNFLYSFAYFPWALIFFHKILKSNNVYNSILFGLLMALMFLGGNPNIIFFFLLFLLFYLIVQTYFFYRKGHLNRIVTKIKHFSLSGLIALLLTGAQIKEVVDFLPFSRRQNITYDFAKDGSLAWKQLSTIVDAKVFGYYGEGVKENLYWLTTNKVYHYWETAFYFGVSTFVLAVIGFWYYRKRHIIIVGLLSTIFFVLYALGENGPIFKFLFEYVPAFDTYRIPARALCIPVFIFSIAAAFGMQKLMKLKKWNRRFIGTLSVAMGLFLYAYYYLTNHVSVPAENQAFFDASTSKGILIFGITVGMMAFSIFKAIPRYIIGSALIVLLFVDLSLVNKSYKNSADNPEAAYNLEKSPLAQLYPKLPGEFFRIGPKNGGYRYLRRNGGIHMQLFSSDGLYGIQKKNDRPSGVPYNRLLTRKYTIGPKEQNGRPTNQWEIVEDDGVFDYLRLMYAYEIFDGQPESLTDFDFVSKVALDSHYEGLENITTSPQTEGTVQMVDYSLNERRIDVNTSNTAILSIGEYFYPGWKVWIDERSTELLKLNYVHQGVIVPPGQHSITLKYYKPGTLFLIAIHVLTMLGLAGYIAYTYYQKMRKT